MFFILHRHTTTSSRSLKMYQRISLEKSAEASCSFQRFKKMTNNETLEPEA
ncbi:unnamed protein product [Arabidopsis halleri]